MPKTSLTELQGFHESAGTSHKLNQGLTPCSCTLLAFPRRSSLQSNYTAEGHWRPSHTQPRVEIGIGFELGCLVGLINVHIRPTLVQVVVELIGFLGVESVDEVSISSISSSGCSTAMKERWE